MDQRLERMKVRIPTEHNVAVTFKGRKRSSYLIFYYFQSNKFLSVPIHVFAQTTSTQISQAKEN